jgi:DNA-binding transcriptional LysR family regulator
MRAPRQASPRPTDDADVTTAKATIERRRPELDARLLRTFVTIVDVRSFTRAGRRLGLSQSAISQQIAAQERQLGVKLLRSAPVSGRTPSSSFHYAPDPPVDEAQRMLTVYDATAERRPAHRCEVRRVRASVAADPASHEEFPRVELRVQSGLSPRSDRTTSRGLPDRVAVAAITEPKLRIFEMGRDELVLITAPTHAFASRRRVEVPELAGQPLLVYERRSSTYRLVERALLEASIFPRIVMELDHLGAVASMVRAGLGLAIVPRWAVADDLAAGRLAGLTIGKIGLARAWGLGLRAEDHQPQTLRAFVRLCLERLPALLTA